MTSLSRDKNSVTVIAGVLDTDGTTITAPTATLSTHVLDVSDGTTGSIVASQQARRDANQVTTMLAVSSSDGATPVELAVNSSGQLLIQQT